LEFVDLKLLVSFKLPFAAFQLIFFVQTDSQRWVTALAHLNHSPDVNAALGTPMTKVQGTVDLIMSQMKIKSWATSIQAPAHLSGSPKVVAWGKIEGEAPVNIDRSCFSSFPGSNL
jgi:hypothetical protein